MRTVLWGRRRGDIQFGSRDDWRRHIPIGAPRITVGSGCYFDVGESIELRDAGPGSVTYRIVGLEGNEVGIE